MRFGRFQSFISVARRDVFCQPVVSGELLPACAARVRLRRAVRRRRRLRFHREVEGRVQLPAGRSDRELGRGVVVVIAHLHNKPVEEFGEPLPLSQEET